MFLCKAYPVFEEKLGKCVKIGRYFDSYVVFEMFRGECIRHRSVFKRDPIEINMKEDLLQKHDQPA